MSQKFIAYYLSSNLWFEILYDLNFIIVLAMLSFRKLIKYNMLSNMFVLLKLSCGVGTE